MATQNFINECKNRANANRLGKFTIDNLAVNQANYLVSMTFKDNCYVNNTIIGSLYTRSADIKLLNLPANTELVGKTITPEVGVRYANDTEEYIQFDDYVIESPKDEQTASNTEFTAMNGGALLDKEYQCNLSFENGETHTINEFYQDAVTQIGLTPLEVTFDNSEIVMTGNPFQNKESVRIVIQEVERVSCTIADINWHDQTISLGWLSNQIDYEFNTSDYSTLEGSLAQYGPLNVIILGNAQLDGENVTMTDAESVAEYGEHQIMIDAPYFLYTEALRTQAIQAIYDKLDGLTYYDLSLTTPYGKPFLKIGDKIRINTNENQVYDTYVLSHTFTFDGAFKSVIESPALTSEEQKVKNEYKGKSITERLKRTEVIVDKTTGDITAINQRVDDVEDEFGNYCTIDKTNELIAQADTGITNRFSEAGGNNIFRNTGLWFANTSQNEIVGKNKYNFNKSGEAVSVTYTIEGSEILLDGTTDSADYVFNTKTTSTITLKAGTYTFSSGILSGTFNRGNKDLAIYLRKYDTDQTVASSLGENNYSANYTFSITEDTTYYVQSYTNGSGVAFNNLKIWFQIEEGSNATEYEPYTISPYEFWVGNVIRQSEEKAANQNALKLQKNKLTQSQIVPNGNYTVSFKYKKLLPLSTITVKINGTQYELTGNNEEKEFVTGIGDIPALVVNSQNIQIDFESNVDNACEIYDLMVNAGQVRLAYSQNQNETTTDTVNISKGITITSSDTETTFKANSDGIRTLDNNNNELAKFTDKGMTTKEMIVREKAQITGLLFQQIGGQVWISKI